MDINREVLPKAYKPISPWGYVGYQLLYSIPLVGFIIWLIHAVSARNNNVKNFARSYICFVIIGLAMAIIICIATVVLIGTLPSDYIEQILQELQKYSQDPSALIR